MPCIQRAVLLRAAAAVLVLSAAVGADQTVVGEALARRGAERAEREAYVCTHPPAAAQRPAGPDRAAGCGSTGR